MPVATIGLIGRVTPHDLRLLWIAYETDFRYAAWLDDILSLDTILIVLDIDMIDPQSYLGSRTIEFDRS